MREEIEARPAVVLLTGLMLGLIAISCPPTLLFLIWLAVWVRPLRSRTLLAGAFVVGLALSPLPPRPILEPFHLSGIGRVASVPTVYPEGQVCEFEIAGRLLNLTVPKESSLILGDRLRVDGEAKPLRSTGPSRTYQPAEGKMRADQFEVVSQGSWIAHLADDWRRSFMSYLEAVLPTKSAALTDAVCFNARNLIDSQTREELAASGTIHILSASGLQVFIIAALITMSLRFVPMHRWVTLAVLAAVLTLYSLAAGLQPQIVRASLMAILGLSAFLVNREPDALSALAISGIGYLLWRPGSIYSMSFQVSMVTVAAIALFYQPLTRKERASYGEVVRVSINYFRLSLVVMLATMPLIAYYLGTVSVVSVAANLLMCWMAPALIVCGFVGYFVWLAIPDLGAGIGSALVDPLCRGITTLLDWVGQGQGLISVPGFSPLWLIAFYGAWLMTYRRRVVQP